MGYQTDFEGRFELDRPMQPEHAAYINKFAETRRMRRAKTFAAKLPDPLREAVGLPLGEEAEFFVGGSSLFGQDHDDSVIDYNVEPSSQPGLWCKWVVTSDLKGIEWSGAEKFYDYTEWLQYLIENFLKRWGYELNGSVTWQGEDPADFGTLCCVDNEVTAVTGKHELQA